MSRPFQQRDNQPYTAPELDTTTAPGFTYGVHGSLALVYGINVPFLSKLAQDALDNEGYYLWTSPPLILILAEAADAFRKDDRERNQELLTQAINYCNEFLADGNKLAGNAILRLTWAKFGVASVTCEKNNRSGGLMDVVRHGHDTMVLVAPRKSSDSPIISNMPEDDNTTVFFPTGVPRAQREERPQRRSGGYSRGSGGHGRRGAVAV